MPFSMSMPQSIYRAYGNEYETLDAGAAGIGTGTESASTGASKSGTAMVPMRS